MNTKKLSVGKTQAMVRMLEHATHELRNRGDDTLGKVPRYGESVLTSRSAINNSNHKKSEMASIRDAFRWARTAVRRDDERVLAVQGS